MPTIPHEAPLFLLRGRPTLIAELLADALGIAIPPFVDSSAEDANFTQLTPTEFRADLVITLRRDDEPVMGIVIEVQLATDPKKRFTWPLYVAALHAKLRCPTALVVIAPDDAVARWAREPIATLQPGSAFTPLVIGRAQIPVITSSADAVRAPELAALSLLAHGAVLSPERELAVAQAAHAAARSLEHDLDPNKHALYTDIVMFAASPAARAALEIEMNIDGYEFKSEYFLKKFATAAAQGEARGEARAVLSVLDARGITVDDATRASILACTDTDRLERLVRRAVTAATAEDILREP